MALAAAKQQNPPAKSRPDSPVGPAPCAACAARRIALCSVLKAEELCAVASIARPIRVDSGSPVFLEGEEAKNVFSVTAGTIKIYKLLADGRRQITGFLFAGDFLGLACDEVYAYSAEAVTEAHLCRFPRAQIERVLNRFPELSRRLLGVASHELAVAQDQMLLLGRKMARERLASFLMMLSARAARRGLPANPIALPMSRTDIGDYLGLTTETVSRVTTRLRQDGIVALLPDGRIDVRDRAALQALAEGN